MKYSFLILCLLLMLPQSALAQAVVTDGLHVSTAERSTFEKNRADLGRAHEACRKLVMARTPNAQALSAKNAELVRLLDNQMKVISPFMAQSPKTKLAFEKLQSAKSMAEDAARSIKTLPHDKLARRAILKTYDDMRLHVVTYQRISPLVTR